MSESNPGAWGVDLHPVYQWDFNFEQAREQGWRFVFIKTSEGPYRDGSVQPLPGLKEFVKRAEDADFDIGLYAFLVESFENAPARSGEANAEHYLRRCEQVGGLEGKLVVPDFEAYAKQWAYLSPSNGNLEAFNKRVRGEVPGGYPLVVYSTHGYWSGGDASGPVEQYGTKLTWDAELAAVEVVPNPRAYYHTMEHWGWNSRVWGGVEPTFWQFTWAGRVDGLNVDTNACKLSPDEYRALWRRAS